MSNKQYSTNELAEKIVGKRENSIAVVFDQPAELDYHCPVCKYKHTIKGEFDERLQWSEYNGFIGNYIQFYTERKIRLMLTKIRASHLE